MIVTRSFFDIGGRKYLELDGIRVKVPFRYGRVMCDVVGLVTVQELVKGQRVRADIQEKMWEGQKFLVLKEIEALDTHVES